MRVWQCQTLFFNDCAKVWIKFENLLTYLEINAKLVLTVGRTLLWIVTISLGKTGFRRSSFFAGPGLFFFTKTILWKKANDLVKLLYDIDNKIGKIMIINKVINNNVLSTHDENNREIVLMGKGIGFQKKVGDEVAEDKIEKKFVLDSEDEVGKFSELIEMIPHNYLNLSVDIISYAQQVMSKRLSPSIYISLTDHINFLLERSTKGELFENPLFNEIKSFYPSEYLVGEKALELIESEAGIKLPQDEAASIALHFVIAEYNMGMSDTVNATTMIRECISIVEKELGIKLDELGLHWSRFITHLKFFAQRMFAGELLDNQDQEFLDMIINKYPKEYDISEKISQFVQSKYGYDIPKEEKVYLAVYIKRIQPHIEI